MATKFEYISRRRFTVAGLSAGAALLSPSKLFAGSTKALSGESIVADMPMMKTGTNTSFASLKQTQPMGPP